MTKLKRRIKPHTEESSIKRLATYAVANGLETQEPTNPWELMRVRVAGGMAIIWKNKSGKETWNNHAIALRSAFEKNEPFPETLRFVPKVRHNSKGSPEHRTLKSRDGEGCFFCGEELEQMTIEHLVPRIHGGPNHLSNKFRSCQKHNAEAGHMSAPEKIAMRDRIRAHHIADIVNRVG